MTEETLFHLALQEPVAERAAFLEKLCGDDHAQRQRVEALLYAAEQPGDFLAQAPVQQQTTAEDTPPLEGPGSRTLGRNVSRSCDDTSTTGTLGRNERRNCSTTGTTRGWQGP